MQTSELEIGKLAELRNSGKGNQMPARLRVRGTTTEPRRSTGQRCEAEIVITAGGELLNYN